MFKSVSNRYFREDQKYFLRNQSENTLIYSWLNGEISGKRCAKQLVDMSVSMTSGFAGGLIGVSLVSPPGTIGMLLSCVICIAVSSEVAGALSNQVTSVLFSETT